MGKFHPESSLKLAKKEIHKYLRTNESPSSHSKGKKSKFFSRYLHLSMLGFTRIFCCSNIPKSTNSDYFFDPRVITIGLTRFQPEKIQNTVEDHEFQKMREEMITVGGSNLKTAKSLYFSMVVFAIICLIW